MYAYMALEWRRSLAACKWRWWDVRGVRTSSLASRCCRAMGWDAGPLMASRVVANIAAQVSADGQRPSRPMECMRDETTSKPAHGRLHKASPCRGGEQGSRVGVQADPPADPWPAFALARGIRSWPSMRRDQRNKGAAAATPHEAHARSIQRGE